MPSSLSQMEALWKLVLTVGLLGSLCEGSISCKNEGGDDIDWFILYKKNAGFDFVYIDSNSQNLKKGKNLIKHQEGVLAHTLKPYFENSPDSGFIAYNDQPPPDSKSAAKTYGHSKGVVMMDKRTVVWLLHSTPRFPFSKESNSFYPDTGEKNAQIFLCVTLKNTADTKIDQHLKGINAYRFDEHQPEILKVSTQTRAKQPYSEDLWSRGGQKFKRFVKNKSKKDNPEEGDLYVTIADTLETDLYIQTWRSKPEDIYTTKNGYELYNIESVTALKNYEWDHGNDHSKWCVSKSGDWTCVADSNREPSQFERPGGALCIENESVADAFRGLISKPVTDAFRKPKRIRYPFVESPLRKKHRSK